MFHSPAQTTAHSPELIFHIMKSRDQTSVLLSVVRPYLAIIGLTLDENKNIPKRDMVGDPYTKILLDKRNISLEQVLVQVLRDTRH